MNAPPRRELKGMQINNRDESCLLREKRWKNIQSDSNNYSKLSDVRKLNFFYALQEK